MFYRKTRIPILLYTNPSLMRSRPFLPKNPKNRCGNPVYEASEIGERPYKHTHFLANNLALHYAPTAKQSILTSIFETTKILYSAHTESLCTYTHCITLIIFLDAIIIYNSLYIVIPILYHQHQSTSLHLLHTTHPPHGSPQSSLSYTNPSLMRSRRIFRFSPKNRCGNPVYASPKTGERPYKHASKFRKPMPPSITHPRISTVLPFNILPYQHKIIV
jgi:hypothetical protein